MINPFKIGIFKEMLSKRLGVVSFEGKKQPGIIYIPYGMFVNIQKDIPTGILLDQGNEESLVLLPFDIENREDLEENEIGFGIPSEKARMYFRKGKITFKTDDTEGGDYAVRYLELKSAFDELKQDLNDLVSAFNSHMHATAAPGPPSPPTPIPSIIPASTSTASVDDAKIDKIELPEL